MTYRTRSRLAALAFAAAVVPALAACSATNEPATMISYQPGDGVSAHLDSVDLRNMVVIADKKGGPGTLSAMAFNTSGQPVDLSVSAGEGESAKVSVPAHGSTVIGGSEGALPSGTSQQQVAFRSVSVPPGGLLEVTVTGPGGSTAVKVPVHAATGIYQGFTQGPVATEPATPLTTESAATATTLPTATGTH